jgi:transcriptional regulator with XRE-family HTH domain
MVASNGIGKAVKWLIDQRTRRGLSQRELAIELSRMGEIISNTTISEAEKGVASPVTWIRLAVYFDAPVSLVLGWAGVIPSKSGKLERIIEKLGRLSPEQLQEVEQWIAEIGDA